MICLIGFISLVSLDLVVIYQLSLQINQGSEDFSFISLLLNFSLVLVALFQFFKQLVILLVRAPLVVLVQLKLIVKHR